jgi:hypothetical protein
MLMDHCGSTVGITDPHYLIYHIHHITLITGDSGCTPVTFVGPGIELSTIQYVEQALSNIKKMILS